MAGDRLLILACTLRVSCFAKQFWGGVVLVLLWRYTAMYITRPRRNNGTSTFFGRRPHYSKSPVTAGTFHHLTELFLLLYYRPAVVLRH